MKTTTLRPWHLLVALPLMALALVLLSANWVGLGTFALIAALFAGGWPVWVDHCRRREFRNQRVRG